MDDTRWMRLALSLGARGLGRVWPNPAVGCVLVRDGRVVGRGWTAPGGRPHAEVVALAQAGDAAQGATAYVTLEPCNHQGTTGPCAEALIASGVARVVIAARDPNRIAAGGAARLRAAGVEVVEGVLEREAADAHRGFFKVQRDLLPMVTLKLATSIDGRIATASGESQWITGPEARRWVHGMRMRHDAVMVGAGTARADDPGLTVRGLGAVHQPVRVVLSRRLDVPVDGQLGRTARDVPVWMVHGPDAPGSAQEAWSKTGARLVKTQTGPGGQIDVHAAMMELAKAGLTRVFCEGGGTLAAALLSVDVVDDLALFGGGLALGAEGVPAIGAMGIAALGEAPRFTLESVSPVGLDSLVIWRRPAADVD
ncbi:bifunctional diaminohydroxyphosphoribosylaminopyrimidine deaminase/5-amino-6-(5-phosphoribosylamino)uracil reductase RibD [Gymnodinialimonas hymeniacidonis]|uniref:bifunctional diaminohydroxyphosphoribosylaminopyrimidine deaminase/5-amino-6-(5-phosphoribosylamino)uracil reductase RibD n=1 Tax=Gymnodinialimonas hymeniacidonis TaxID=3126508 RepID=UPI0034C67DA2